MGVHLSTWLRSKPKAGTLLFHNKPIKNEGKKVGGGGSIGSQVCPQKLEKHSNHNQRGELLSQSQSVETSYTE